MQIPVELKQKKNKKIQAIIDTGSNVTCLADDRHYTQQDILKRSEINATGLCNEPVEVLGRTHINVRIQKKKINGKIEVIKADINFLYRYRARIDFAGEYIQFGFKHNKVTIQMDPNQIKEFDELEYVKEIKNISALYNEALHPNRRVKLILWNAGKHIDLKQNEEIEI